MRHGVGDEAATQAAWHALAGAAASTLARVAQRLGVMQCEASGDPADGTGDEAAALLLQIEGALALAQQPAVAALVRLMRAQSGAAGIGGTAMPAGFTEAMRALQRGVAHAFECAQRQHKPRAARLLPCWRQLAALGHAVDASPAVLLSLQLPADTVLPLPAASPCGDGLVDPLADALAAPLAGAERALLACLRADRGPVPGQAAQAFANAVAVVAVEALQDGERACWLALHAYLQELAVAQDDLPASGKRFLAAILRALRHRHRAGLCDVLEPLARDALLALSQRPLQTEQGMAVARLFRLDEQLGAPVAADEDAPPREAALAGFASALAQCIAELERDPAPVADSSLWQMLAGEAGLARCAAALADPLRRLAARSPQMQDPPQRELLAALLMELQAWSVQGRRADPLVAIIDLAGTAEPAVAGLALHRHRLVGGARQRLTDLCAALRAELDAAEPPLEAAWQGGDGAQAMQQAADALSRVAGALAVAGLRDLADAANALRERFVACRDEDPRTSLTALAADWVRLAAGVARLACLPDAEVLRATCAEDTPAADVHEAGRRLRTIFIDEAAGYLHQLRRLAQQCEAGEMVAARRAAHTLAGCSATVGQPAMASLALALESHLLVGGWRPGNALLAGALDALEQMLADFSEAGQCDAPAGLLAQLRAEASGLSASEDGGGQQAAVQDDAADDAADYVADYAAADTRDAAGSRIDTCAESSPDAPNEAVDIAPATGGHDGDPASDAVAMPWPSAADAPGDELSSQELLASFREEAADLLPQLELALHAWQQHPDGSEPPRQLLRLLHTLKGGARMAGRLALGEAFHEAEAEIAALAQQPADTVLRALPVLQARFDGWMQGSMPAAPAAVPAAHAGVAGDRPQEQGAAVPHDAATDAASPAQQDDPAGAARQRAQASPEPAAGVAPAPQLRVSADRLARVADAAAALWVGNGGITDAAQDQRLAVASLSEDLARLRAQLRELEIEAESRIVAHASPEGDAGFDPLEFDRYTRLHELTRLMAESLADLAGTQRGLARQVERLASVASLQARDLRRFGIDLQAMRSQPLRTIEPRLRHLLRQAAQEAGREATLRLAGADVEIERSVLDRLAGPLGHLLRNAVVHGIEAPEQRLALGKPRAGAVTLGAALAGSELRLWLHDDGAGIDRARVRSRALAIGLLGAHDEPDDAALAALIFAPGFSTASEVTALSGRGIGMDAVRAELQALGGRIAVDSVAGQGCRFTLTLPVALASLPVLLATAGTRRIALPAAQILQVVQPRAGQVEQAAGGRQLAWRDSRLGLRHLGEALGERCGLPAGDTDRLPVVIVGDGERRLALQLDSVQGQRELMFRHPGPQLSRVPGIAGATLLGDGSIALILDPFRLPDTPPAVAEPAPERPLVLVVDDSLTVRRASQRLLERHGYAVALARDGLEALERLVERRPAALLLDIEMPRMDGFELLATLRADAGLCDLPVVMITSRIAGRHRERAQQLGVLGYLGKPFDEEALLALLDGLQGGARLAA